MSLIKSTSLSVVPSKPPSLYITEPCRTCVPERSENLVQTNPNITGGLVGFDRHHVRQQITAGVRKYQNVQFHPGQMEMLKQSINSKPEIPTLILVNATLAHDVYYLDDLMASSGMKRPYRYLKRHKSNKNLKHSLDQNHIVSVPIKIFQCCVEDEFYYDRKEDECWELVEVPQLLRYVTLAMEEDATYEVRIVQAVISKDHDVEFLWGVGTVVVHLIQPFYFREFDLQHYQLPRHLSLIHHFASDTATCAPVLAPSIMAFILCYMDHVGSIHFDEIDHMFEWFRRSAVSNNVHLAFTGQMEFIREYCFIVLGEYIQVYPDQQLVVPVKYDKLKDQAEVIVPKMARIGLFAYAMLLAHNSRSAIPLSKLKIGLKISKKKVLHHAQKTLEFLENRMLFRKPCVPIEQYIITSFNAIGQLYGYFSLTDPAALQTNKNGFGGDDCDSDYPSDIDDDPMYEAWISLSPRPYRVERLNLCLNAIHEYARETAAKSTTRRHGELPSAPSPTEINTKFLTAQQ